MSRLCTNRMAPSNKPVFNTGEATQFSIVAAIIPDRDISDDHTSIIMSCHNSIAGHGGVERTISMLQALNHSWLYLRQDVKKFISTCPACQKMSVVAIPIHAKGILLLPIVRWNA